MIDNTIYEKFRQKYEMDPTNKVIEHAIANVGIKESSIRQEVIRKHNFVFSNETKRGEITNQKRSGRCWMFSALNVARVKTMEKLNLETFEYSQCYLQFYDKIEKANSYLDYVIETREKPITDRLVQHILNISAEDGGYWNFFSGLANKYGLVPKKCMPETYHSSNTDILNEVIDLRLKKATSLIRKEKCETKISKIKEDTLYEIYNICVKALGMPPKTVEFEYKDKDKNYHKISGVTPLEFMKEYAPEDLLDMIEIVADPRKDNEIARVYELPYTHSVKEYGNSRFLNVTIDELKKAIILSIKDGIPVWFACDVSRFSDRELGIMDSDLYDYDNTLTKMDEFTKEERLINGASFLTHAMTITGVDLDENRKPLMWQVENSWGEDSGEKGIFSMSDKWFDEHTYSAVVDTKYISDEFKNGLEKEVITLNFFDPLG